MKDSELPRPLKITPDAGIYRGDLGYRLPNGGKLRVRNLDLTPFGNHAPSLARLGAYLSGLSAPDSNQTGAGATQATQLPSETLSDSPNDGAQMETTMSNQGQGSEGTKAGGIKSENKRDEGLTNKGTHGDTGVGDKKLSNQTDKKTGTDEPGNEPKQQ